MKSTLNPSRRNFFLITIGVIVIACCYAYPDSNHLSGMHPVESRAVSSQEKVDTRINNQSVDHNSPQIHAADNGINKKSIVDTCLIITSLGILISAITVIVMWRKQQVKTKQNLQWINKVNELSEERWALAESELEQRKLIETQLRDQIELKDRELTTYALNLIQKNEILQRLKDNLKDIHNGRKEDLPAKLNSLTSLVNYSMHLDKDWDNFKTHFQNVHKSFFDNLSKLNLDLNANDMKLCALIKLNMDTKKAATILDISPESAKVARYRLRRKLNLSTEQSLSSYLAAF